MIPFALSLPLAACQPSTSSESGAATESGGSTEAPTDDDNDVASGTGAVSDSQSASSGDSNPSSPSTSGVAETGVDSSSTAAEPEFVPYAARSIYVDRIVANQGVEVPVVLDGEWVDGSQRNAQMLKDRNTMIRAFWQVDEGYVPREVEARLTMILADGTEEVASRFVTPEGPSNPIDIDSTAYFVIPGELIQPSVQFQLEMFETEYGHEDEPEAPIAAYPPEPGFLGIESTPMALRTVLVPIAHTLSAECPEAPDLNEDVVQVFSDQLYMQNPVSEVELIVRDTVNYGNSMQSFGPVLSFLADLRAQDNADPGYYYYGLVRPCDGGPDGVGGQAISIPGFADPSNAWARTAVGRFYASNGTTANTFVHEIGHTQGRRHVFCSGEEGGSDPSYPYDGGDLGVWGFGVLDFSLHSPTTGKDYMTYCGNTWVSDWGWRAVVPYIQTITSWEGADVGQSGDGDILVGLIDPATNEEAWFVTTGNAGGRTIIDSDQLAFTSVDGLTTTLDATVGPMGDGDAYNVVVELPSDVDVATARSIIRHDHGANVPVRSVRVQGVERSLAL